MHTAPCRRPGGGQLEQLSALSDEGLVKAKSIFVVVEIGMIGFAYPCGVWGGILLQDPDDANDLSTLSLSSEVQQPLTLTDLKKNKLEDFGTAMIYYAFDNTINSSRYPYYSYMKGFWSALGLDTRLDTTVTISDLK